MGLRFFHLVFIGLSAAMFLWVGFWCLDGFSATRSPGYLVFAALSVLISMGLGAYAAWFFKRSRGLGLMAIYATLGSSDLQACAVCFADPNSTMAQSTNAGILFLLVVIVAVLIAFAALFFSWARRSKLSI